MGKKKKKGLSLKVRLILERGDGQVLFLKQRIAKGGKYTLAGGSVEDLEFAKTALIREVSEEIGISLDSSHLSLVHSLHKRKEKDAQLIMFFRASLWSGIPYVKEPHKFEQVVWLSLEELPFNMSSTLRDVLNYYRLGVAYSESKVWAKKNLLTFN